jgi:hypothetical protein
MLLYPGLVYTVTSGALREFSKLEAFDMEGLELETWNMEASTRRGKRLRGRPDNTRRVIARCRYFRTAPACNAQEAAR